MRKFGNSWILGPAAVATLCIMALPAVASPSLGVDYSSANSFACNSSCIDGYEFSVGAGGITVLALGAFDGSQGGPSNGGSPANLSPGEFVNLYNSTGGAPLASISVGAGGTQVNTFWDFVNLATPLGLQSGTYVVVAADTSTNQDISFPTNTSDTVTPVGGITYLQDETCTGCSLSSSGSLSYLSGNGKNDIGLSSLGGNIEYNVGLPPKPLPEPISLSLFGAGLVGAATLRRRKAPKA